LGAQAVLPTTEGRIVDTFSIRQTGSLADLGPSKYDSRVPRFRGTELTIGRRQTHPAEQIFKFRNSG